MVAEHPHRLPAGRLHLDHVRTELGEQLRGVRAGPPHRQIEDAQSVQQRHGAPRNVVALTVPVAAVRRQASAWSPPGPAWERGAAPPSLRGAGPRRGIAAPAAPRHRDRIATALPTEALAAWAAGLNKVRAHGAPLDEKETKSNFNWYTAEVLINLLAEAPARLKVRSAAYRALATVDGVEFLGQAKDPRAAGRARRSRSAPPVHHRHQDLARSVGGHGTQDPGGEDEDDRRRLD